MSRTDYNRELREKATVLKLKGLTYKEVGAALGVTPQRAHQLSSPPHRIRVLIRNKAGSRCRGCGIKLANGHIHHSKVKDSEPGVYNDIENLIYLCASCHRKTHSNEVQKSRPAKPQVYCKQCGYQFINPPKSRPPKMCARCRSRHWNEGPKINPENEQN